MAFNIASFDTRAAIELADINRKADGDKRSGTDEPYQKIKIDRQIVAIAKVAGARTIYTNDKGLRTFAREAEIKTTGVHELPLPPEKAQSDFMELLENQQREEDEPQPDEIEADEDEKEDDEEGPE